MSKDMLVMELSCAQCGAVLTEGTRLHLDGNVRKTNEDGEIYLSAVFDNETAEQLERWLECAHETGQHARGSGGVSCHAETLHEI